MDLIDQAIAFEKEGHQFFMDHAARVSNPTVKFILESLAEDELKHIEYLEKLRDGSLKEYQASPGMKNIKNALEKAVKQNPHFLADDPSIRSVLESAMAVEQNAKEQYTKEALAQQSPENREFLEKIAKEEDRHYWLLKNLLDFYENPKNILEDQEFQYYEL